MHGMDNFKITDAQEANIINNFKNVKEKLLKTKAAIWFNKTCRRNQLTSKYIQIKRKVTTNQVETLNLQQ
jgi:hypothetical protein